MTTGDVRQDAQEAADDGSTGSTLVRTLIRELLVSEAEASRGPLLEVERLGNVPPAWAMLAVAEHAAAVLRELLPLARARGVGAPTMGLLSYVGLLHLRDRVTGLLATREKSFRTTLVNLHRGFDAAALLEATARRDGDFELAAYCARWLEQRKPLVESAVAHVTWFSDHRDAALAPAKDGFWARRAKRIARLVHHPAIGPAPSA